MSERDAHPDPELARPLFQAPITSSPVRSPQTVANGRATRRYRVDLDGLRGVAILAVVAFHGGLPIARGGYVGVDVFFVVSGYLIVGLLVRDTEDAGHVRFAHFYARRFRRLLPAFATMIIGVLGLGATMLTAGEMESLAKSGIAAVLSVANSRRGGGYFAPGGESRPLLHMWSLSLEEQFYLLAPASVLLVLRLARGRDLRASVKILMLAVCMSSFALNLWLLHRGSTVAAFYWMPARAWEIAAGGILACAAPREAGDEPSAWLLVTCEVLGIGAILISVCWFDQRTVFPGIAALLPVVGTMLLILRGEWSGVRGQPLLAAAPLALIGRASYSWYLWHWPLLTLVRVARGPDPWRDLAVVIGSLVLALVTYRLIELPARRTLAPFWSDRAILRLGGALVVVLLAFQASVLVATRHAAAAGPAPGRAAIAIGDASRGREHCHLDFDADTLDVAGCWLRHGTSRRVVVAWGDSHANAWMPMLDEVVSQDGGRVGLLQFTKTSCPPLIGLTPWNGAIGDAYPSCRVFNDRVLHMLQALHSRGYELSVVLAARWPAYTGADPLSHPRADNFRTFFDERNQSFDGSIASLDSALRLTLSALDSLSVTTGIILPSPELVYDAPSCVVRWRKGAQFCAVNRDELERYRAPVATVIGRAARDGDHISLFDPADVLCDRNRCPAAIDDVLLYIDDNHPSVSGARWGFAHAPAFARGLIGVSAP